jgi:hypothetical protein
MVNQVSNDTVFTGTYTQEGTKIIATILAGEQKASVFIYRFRMMSRRLIWVANKTSPAILPSRKMPNPLKYWNSN